MVNQNVDISNLEFIDSGDSIIFDSNSIYSARYPTDSILSQALQPAYNAAYPWTTDLSMMPWARAVMQFYNIDIPSPCGINCKTWGSRSGAYKFDAAVNYFKTFNYRLSYTQQDCQLLTSMISAMNDEVQNVQQEAASKVFGTGEMGVRTQILNDLKTYYNTWIAKLDCVNYLNDTANQKQVQQDLSTLQQQSTIQSHQDLPSTILLYAMIGIVLIVGGVILIKRMNK